MGVAESNSTRALKSFDQGQDCPVLEYLSGRERQAFLLRTRSDPEDEQRVSAEFEDAVRDTDAIKHEHVGPYLGKLLLIVGAGRCERPLRILKPCLQKCLRIRQALTIDLPVRRPRKLREREDGRWAMYSGSISASIVSRSAVRAVVWSAELPAST